MVAEAKQATKEDLLKAELAERTLARRRLMHFVKKFKPDYLVGWVHEDICRRLERFVMDVEMKKSPRLLLCMPPRGGKSELSSRKFPAWVLGQHPEWEIIAASHTQSLALSFSRHIRDLLRDPAYHAIFPDAVLDPSSQSVENWMTTAEGGYLAAGVGTAITGRGCLAPYTRVDTSRGKLPIAELKVGDVVYGYDHRLSKVVETRVIGVQVTQRGTKLLEDRSRGIRLTEDHRVFDAEVEEYAEVGKRQSLSGLWREEGTARCYMQRVLFETASGVEHNAAMRQLWGDISAKHVGAPEVTGSLKDTEHTCFLQHNLLQGVQEGEPSCLQQGESRVPVVQRSSSWIGSQEVLRTTLLHEAPGEESQNGLIQRCIFDAEEARSGEGHVLPDVRQCEISIGNTSCERELGRQLDEQSDSLVCTVPPQISSTAGVSAIDLAGAFQPFDFVVDIQTESGNFFADGLLVHNCQILIIDDPVKDAANADSQTVRDNTWDWYTCFHPDTEILTYWGWKSISEVSLGEAVATMDMSSGEMYYMPATDVQEYDFDGELVDVWQRSGVSYRVTPNHNLHISSSKTGPIRTVRADETPEIFYIPRSAKVFLGGTPPQRTGFKATHANGKDFICPTTTWFRFFGAWLGDGSVYVPKGQVVLSAIKTRKREFFTSVLKDMGVTFWEQEKKVTFQNVEIARYLERFGGSHEKYVPENMKHATTPYLEALLDGLFETDGHTVDEGRRYRYVTMSKQLADDVMEISVKCGYAVSYSLRPGGAYHLSVRKTQATQVDTRVRGKTSEPVRKMVPYKGKVNCVTVPPHHSVLVRDRGRISWSGQSTAYTRLAPGGGVIGIMTLWHDDDWGGRIIEFSENDTGDKFEIVRYPAINEGYDEYQDNMSLEIIKKLPADPVPQHATLIRTAGSALHPDRYDIEALLRIKTNLYVSGKERVWSALYQQNPAPDEGAFFHKDMFKYYSTAPSRRSAHVFQAWDFAISESEISDYTVGVTVLQDSRDTLHVLDVRRFKSADAINIVDIILDYFIEWQADMVGFEDGQIWKTLRAQLEKRCVERRVYPAWDVLQPLTDKLVRAGPLKGRMRLGKVLFDKEARWFHDCQQEMLRFPAGKHDDQIDALAWAVRMTLDKSAPREHTPSGKIASWKDRLTTESRDSGSFMSA